MKYCIITLSKILEKSTLYPWCYDGLVSIIYFIGMEYVWDAQC